MANATPDAVKSQGPIARQWIKDAIAMVSKRPDLTGKLPQLQRLQQDLEGVLTKNGLSNK